MFAEGPPPERPNQDDASAYLVDYIRSQRASTYGYDIWLPNPVEAYARQASKILPQGRVPPQWVEHLSEPIYAAAWDPVRVNVVAACVMRR
jgi:hypothetical protein